MSKDKKPKKSSHIKDLALLFAIPVGIALFAAAAIYIPRLLADPKYNFIYSVCDDYRCEDDYSVDATGHIVKEPNDPLNSAYDNGNLATIRYYDTESDSTRSLTLEEAQTYQLDTSSKSPDNYRLAKESTSSGFLFWGDSDEGWYLKDGAKKKKIELSNSGSYYSRDIKFLGWVEK